MHASCTLRFAAPLRGDALLGVARFLVLYRRRTGVKIFRRLVPEPPGRSGSRWSASRIPDDAREIRRCWPDEGIALRLPVYPPLERLEVDADEVRMRAAEAAPPEACVPTFAAIVRLWEEATSREPQVAYGAAGLGLEGDFADVVGRFAALLEQAGEFDRVGVTVVEAGVPALRPGGTPDGPSPAGGSRREIAIPPTGPSGISAAVARILGEEREGRRIAAIEARSESGRFLLATLPRDLPAGGRVRTAQTRYPLELVAYDEETYRGYLKMVSGF